MKKILFIIFLFIFASTSLMAAKHQLFTQTKKGSLRKELRGISLKIQKGSYKLFIYGKGSYCVLSFNQSEKELAFKLYKKLDTLPKSRKYLIKCRLGSNSKPIAVFYNFSNPGSGALFSINQNY